MQYTITGQIWITANEHIAITPEVRTLTEEQAEREYGPRRKEDSPTGTQYRSLANFAGSRKTREAVLAPAFTPEQEQLRNEFAARMDELDTVYQRDTRPCIEGKPSVRTGPAPRVQVTKDGPAYLLPGIEPAGQERGEATQTSMF